MLGMGFPSLQNGAGACKPGQDAQAGAGAAQVRPDALGQD